MMLDLPRLGLYSTDMQLTSHTYSSKGAGAPAQFQSSHYSTQSHHRHTRTGSKYGVGPKKWGPREWHAHCGCSWSGEM
eukprot:scaffold61702_cov43-Attheya_sp.AAC.3